MVQTGVHFEEVAEMLEAMEPDGISSEVLSNSTVLMHNARVALVALANGLKDGSAAFSVTPDKAQDLLDALCDQTVTATGVAYGIDFKFPEALAEVSDSNWSKFVDGKPIFDKNGKIMKGPDYFKPDLSKFV